MMAQVSSTMTQGRWEGGGATPALPRSVDYMQRAAVANLQYYFVVLTDE